MLNSCDINLCAGPVVSIIIPIYNVELYLAQCIESVISQTYTNIEIICINDGSEDKSFEILKKFAQTDDRIIVINQSNKGLSEARNVGLSTAKGDLVTFVDSDDWLDYNTIELAVERFQTQIVDCVLFGYRTMYENNTSKINKVTSHGLLLNITQLNSFLLPRSAWGKVYKKQFLLENKLLFPSGLYYEDLAFYWNFVVRARRVSIIQTPLYNYRMREGSIMNWTTSKRKNMVIHHLYEVDAIYNYWNTESLLQGNREWFTRIFEEISYLGFILLTEEERKEYFNGIKFRLRQWELNPRRYTLLYELQEGSKIFNVKIRTARSLWKKIDLIRMLFNSSKR